jgi:hypothetical protein
MLHVIQQCYKPICASAGKSSNYKVCNSPTCNSQVSAKSLPGATTSSSPGRHLLQGTSGKGRGKGLKFAKLSRGYSKADMANVCTNPTNAPALADMGGKLFLMALGMRLAILKDCIENRACEDTGKTVVYLDETVSGVGVASLFFFCFFFFCCCLCCFSRTR